MNERVAPTRLRSKGRQGAEYKTRELVKRNHHPACRSEGSFTLRLSYSVDLDAWLVDYHRLGT